MTQPNIVPFSDDEVPVEVDDLDQPDPANATPQERADRQQRRNSRAAERERERKQLEDDLKAERAERQAIAERLARLEGTFNATQHQRQPQAEDPYKARLDAVYARQNEAYRAVQAEITAKTYTPERERHWNEVSRQLEEAKTEIITERKLAQSEAVNRQASGQQFWKQQYPDVYDNPRAYQFASATFQRRVALGEKDSPELVHEVMAETRTALKLGPKPAPTRSEKDRMTGIASSGGTGGEAAKGGIAPTPQLRRIAEAMYSDLPPDKAFQKWVDGPGKELRKQKIL